MTNETHIEVYRQLRDAQSKYAYFLLTAASAAIAFFVTQTKGAYLMWSQIPLGLAVVLWAVSFYFGCRHLAYVSSNLYANCELFSIQAGQHPRVGSNPSMVEAAARGLLEAMESNSDHANRFAHWQFRLLVAGGVLYVAWHILEMYLRT